MKSITSIIILFLINIPSIAIAQNTTDPNELDLPVASPSNVLANVDFPEPDDPPEAEEPPEFYGEPIPAESGTVFYVVDCSCSMAIDPKNFVDWEGNVVYGSRMDRARSEVIKSFLSLPRSFRFNILAYHCWMSTLSNQGLIQADAQGKQQAMSFCQSQLFAGGGTMTGPACATALADSEVMSVVLLTDGFPNCGASGVQGHLNVIQAANNQGARFTVFGIAPYADYEYFLIQIAAMSGGRYITVQ